MIVITEDVSAVPGFAFYVEKVTAHPTKPMTVEIAVVIEDRIKGHVMPFSIPLEQSSMTITAAEKYLQTLPWATYGKLIDKPE